MSETIWTPPTAGVLPSDVRMAQEAIRAYDENLVLGVDKRTEEWVVLWSKGPGGAPFPVLGLGRELPSYGEIQRKLYMADTVRRGGELVREVTARQEKVKKARDGETHEAAGDVAEHLEHMFHRLDKTSYKRVYMPGKDF